jgi:anhydro-N-acetylmuramic acid kinase
MSGDAYVGLMSGTSLDGISACVVRFTGTAASSPQEGTPQASAGSEPSSRTAAPLRCEVLAFTVVEYSADQRSRLLSAMQGGTAQEYCRLEFDLGGWLADAAVAVLAESGVPRSEVRAIGSHGQTLWHEAPHSTWQAGESAVIAERLGIDVVSDFRVRDVAAGGQGAPLVPVADALLFASPHEWRALQNIGGIGNVTVVPPGGRLDAVRAFDTGPGVSVIDGVVRMLRPELRYDAEGSLARAGNPVPEVVEEMLAHPYFAAEPPKSTGRELFTPGYTATLVRRCRDMRAGCTDEDVIATATALTVRSIADAYRRFLPEPVSEVLVSGGGARNATLMHLLAEAVSPMRVRSFHELYFDGEAKEAVAFALLARLFMDRVPANVPGATGSRGARILGKLTPAETRS